MGERFIIGWYTLRVMRVGGEGLENYGGDSLIHLEVY